MGRRVIASDVAGLFPPAKEVCDQLAELRRLRREGHAAGCYCKRCPVLRAVLFAAGLWRECQG